MNRDNLLKLLGEMTVREKLGQLTQITGDPFVGKIDDEMVETGPEYSADMLQPETLYTIGSVIGASSARITNRIQSEYLQRSRLKIPLLFMHDAIHGYKTIFPIPLALSCSWDERLVERAAEVTAAELRASGIHVNFSPMTDLVRDARWGRVMESFGEDPILSGRLGGAMIRGYQRLIGGRLGPDGVAACLKHFAAYGAGVGGKDYNTVDMSMREFYEFYGKVYEIALQAKPKFVMSAFNTFNGTPVTASEFVLNRLLRETYGFEELVISDWAAVSELRNHRVAKDGKEAAELALRAGVEIEMVSTLYLENAEAIVAQHPPLLEKIDAAVLKVLELKNELGLFEKPYADEETESAVVLHPASREAAREAAIRSCVLLKNEHAALPIGASRRSILIAGPFADSRELLGNWTCKGSFEDVVPLADGLRKLDPSLRIRTCLSLDECTAEELDEADFVLVAIGEPWDRSGEGHSSVNLELDESQRQLVRDAKRLGKPYACVCFSGRPLALQNVIDDIPALLWCWYPGTEAGAAIAELLTGKETPSGKLTMSFPRYSAQTPIYYNEHSTGRPANASSYSSRYQDCEIGPLFPFGHGLTYSNAKYDGYRLSSDRITAEQPITLSFDIRNDSGYAYPEIVILFIEDLVSRSVRPVREMKGYRVVQVPAHGTAHVELTLSLDDLMYVDAELNRTVEPGEFRLYVNDMANPLFTVSYEEAGSLDKEVGR